MNFRRNGKIEHTRQYEWDEWKKLHDDLLSLCQFPLCVMRSRRDWDYLLDYGYWCNNFYGEHVGNIDFDLDELNAQQTDAFRLLLERTLTDEDKQRGCAGWHHVHPPHSDTPLK